LLFFETKQRHVIHRKSQSSVKITSKNAARTLLYMLIVELLNILFRLHSFEANSCVRNAHEGHNTSFPLQSKQQSNGKMSTSNDLLGDLEENLLDQLGAVYAKEGRISDDLLESFFFLYKNQFLEALHALDKHMDPQQSHDTDPTHALVVEYSTLSGRKLYQVHSSSNRNSYHLFDIESAHFCTCSYFKYSLKSPNRLYCKHMILIRLCLAMNRLVRREVNDCDFNDLLKLIK
jgi:predicted nucleic acid-binding Zn finger protein